jgi:hypothetical protein
MINGQLIDEPIYTAVGPSAPPIMLTSMTYHLIEYAYHQAFFVIAFYIPFFLF